MIYLRFFFSIMLISASSWSWAITRLPAPMASDNPIIQDKHDSAHHYPPLFFSRQKVLRDGSGNVVDRQHPLPLLSKPDATPRKALTLSLREAILLALRNNPLVKSDELQRVIDKFALAVAHNAFEPQYSIGASSNLFAGKKAEHTVSPNTRITLPFGTELSGTYNSTFPDGSEGSTFTIKQPLLKGSGWTVNTQAWYNAVDTEQIARLTFKKNIINAIDNVIKQYYALVSNYNNLMLQQRTLKRTQQLTKQIALAVHYGKKAPSDLTQQQSNLTSQRVSLLQTKNSLAQNYQDFLQTLGLDSNVKINILKTINLKKISLPRLTDSLRLVLLHNIEYLQNLINLRAEKRAIKIAKNQLFPELNATYTNTIGHSDSHSSSNLALEFSMPLDNIKGKQTLTNAKISLAKAKLALQAQRQILIREVTKKIASMQLQHQTIQAEIQNIHLQKKSLNAEQIKLQYGKSTVLLVNQQRDNLLAAQQQLISEKINFFISLTDLHTLLGTTLENWHIGLIY